MTEERKLELAEKIHGDCIFRGAVHQRDVVQQTKLILCTIVAEVRKEGMVEGLEANMGAIQGLIKHIKEQG